MSSIFSRFLDFRYSRPDFLIIGAQKCGTTALYSYLEQHPQVKAACFKEVHFFDYRFDRGERWYRLCFPLRQTMNAEAQRLGLPVLTGEASPCYALFSETPQRVRQMLPRAKLIMLMRNPVDRAYSQYQMNRNKESVRLVVNNERTRKIVPREPLSFENALACEDERMAKARHEMAHGDLRAQWFRMHSYKTRGLYAEQIERWFEFFPREQFLFLDSAQLSRDTDATFNRVLDFLDLQSFHLETYEERHVGKYAEPMKDETRAQLVEFFKPHNQKLCDLLGQRFDWDK